MTAAVPDLAQGRSVLCGHETRGHDLAEVEAPAGQGEAGAVPAAGKTATA
ncbi:hypothetical protein ABT093_22270 [Kitasatospora sp. NPDC002551]